MFLKWLYRRLPMRFLIADLYNFFWRGAWRSGIHRELFKFELFKSE